MMRFAFAFLLAAPLTSSFLFPKPMSIKKGLVQVIDAQKATPLSIKLDIGLKENQSHMNVNGLILELSSKIANYAHPKMPGADGPHPDLSSGIRTLNLIQPGSFIDMMGQKTVETLNGCWEMVWRENAAAGSLICGFDLPEEYHRNEASLPKGRIYLSFTIWTKIGLKDAQHEKNEILTRTKELSDEQADALAKMKEEPNFLMKALHYRNASAAFERLMLYDTRRLEQIPSDDDIIPLQDDLLLTTKGLVFAKEGSFKTHGQVLLGAAFASPVIT